MNDPREMHHAIDVLESLVTNDHFIGTLSAKEAPGFIVSAIRRDAALRGFPMFVAAFSKHPDRLSQWRGYGDGGRGYALGFRLKLGAEKPFGGSADVALSSPLSAVRCIYNKKQQAKALDPFVDMFRKLDKCLASSSRPHGETVKAVARHFLRLAVYYEVVLKHPAYDEEAEVRVVCLGVKDTVVSFRDPPGPPVPYVTIRFQIPTDPMPLVDVVTGPRQPFGVAGAKLFLKSREVVTTTVSQSNTPFR
jgi:hypothetical protein